MRWFKWQEKLTNAMGTHYADLGQLEVIKAQPNVAIAKVSMSCDMMQRGDIVRPLRNGPLDHYKDATAFDILGAGKRQAGGDGGARQRHRDR